ncbi:MAG: DUF11 domain-containing protein, partial [Anaerolineales bacterium]|nr:DUF11 domain-containing protein [Anaerolineales bacterium]
GHPAIESSQGSCTAAMGTFTCTIGSLASSATATITLQVNIHPSALGVITNTVFVTSTEGFSNTAAVTSTIVSEADLQLVKNDIEDPVNVGSPLTYTIDVINAGPSTVLSATITDTLPLNMMGTAAGLGWNCTAGNTMTCTIASLLPGTYLDAIVITTTSPITEGVITNTAGITSSLTPETVITNNVVYEDTTVVRLANLAITKEDSPDPVLPGATLTYTITVLNNGPYTATNVIVTDTLPSGLTANLVNTAGWLCAPQIGDALFCGLTSLSPSEVASYTITATAPVSGFLINTAVVSSDILDPDLEDNEAAAFTAIERVSDLSIHKTDAVDPVLAGETITYTVVVTNEGPLPAGVLTTTVERRNGGDINVPILAGESSRYPSSIFIDSVPGLVRNITVTLENVSHTFPQDLSILLVGPTGQSVILMSEAAGGQDADNVTLTFNDSGTPVPTNGLLTDTLVYRPSNYGLSTPFPAPAPAGPYGGSLSAFNNSSPNGQWRLYVIDTVDSDGGVIDGWRLEITAATTDTVTMAEFLPTTSTPSMTSTPAGWQFDALSTHEWAYVTNQLAVGQPVSFTIAVTAPITPGVITNTAVITTTGLDLITSNNTAVITTTVLPLVDLVITKTAAALTAPIGYPIVYTLTVGNHGPSPAIAPITLTDSLPPALTSVTVITNGWNCDTSNLPELSCTIDSLGVGLAPELVVMAQLPVTKGMLTNTAVVTSTLAETDTSNNEAAVTITVSDIPIQGLVATNSSPHVLNVETLLQASIVTGTNVSYVWNLGDGTIISGNPISHTYPTTGTFTAVVTASNDVSVMTASTLVMIDGYNTLYLPVIGHQFVDAPDLEVISLTVSSNNVTIVIANNGGEDAADEFWVDFYVNPFVVPVGPNDIWQNSGGSGAVWGIEGSAIPLAPGETLTLTLNDAYYRPAFSSLTFPITAGSQTYAHVDSANANTTSGAVLENHELLGLPYNNILGPVTSTADVQPITAAPTDRPPLSNKLPPRPH